MAKGEETNNPDWKKRVPYEKSEAAYHKHPEKPIKKATEATMRPEKAKLPGESRERMQAGKETIGGKEIKARPPLAGTPSESTSARACDACGRVHSNRCEIIQYAGQNFNVCGECIPPVRENPADFLAGKKGTDPESMDFDICGPGKK